MLWTVTRRVDCNTEVVGGAWFGILRGIVGGTAYPEVVEAIVRAIDDHLALVNFCVDGRVCQSKRV